MLRKIPILVTAIVITIIGLVATNYLYEYLVLIYWIDNDSQTKIALFSSVVTLVGLFLVVLQIRGQKQNDIIATEYLNQPNFEFLPFQSDRPIRGVQLPVCCCEENKPCTNNCTDEHWFDIRQIGELPVANLSISIFHFSEENLLNKARIHSKRTLIKSDVLQYKLPPGTFNNELYKKNENGSFRVLLSYQSLYSQIRYKRCYELEYTPVEGREVANGKWEKCIQIFAITLNDCIDEVSISFTQMLKGKMFAFLIWAGCKKVLKYEQWLCML